MELLCGIFEVKMPYSVDHIQFICDRPATTVNIGDVENFMLNAKTAIVW